MLLLVPAGAAQMIDSGGASAAALRPKAPSAGSTAGDGFRFKVGGRLLTGDQLFGMMSEPDCLGGRSGAGDTSAGRAAARFALLRIRARVWMQRRGGTRRVASCWLSSAMILTMVMMVLAGALSGAGTRAIVVSDSDGDLYGHAACVASDKSSTAAVVEATRVCERTVDVYSGGSLRTEPSGVVLRADARAVDLRVAETSSVRHKRCLRAVRAVVCSFAAQNGRQSRGGLLLRGVYPRTSRWWRERLMERMLGVEFASNRNNGRRRGVLGCPRLPIPSPSYLSDLLLPSLLLALPRAMPCPPLHTPLHAERLLPTDRLDG